MKKKYKAKVMMEVLGSVLVRVVLLTTILVYTPALAQLSSYNSQGLRATTLEEVLVLPDEEIDLATTLLILCQEWDASLDVTGSLEEIDRMALELEARINPEDSPKKIVGLINQYLYKENIYSSLDSADPRYMKTLEGSALPRVIQNKKGDCLGLSLLYLVLAERLGLPLYGVAAPGHIFVRYDDGKKRINIETTDKGRESEDSYYEKKYMLHPSYRNYDFYLRNLLKREVIGVFISNFGVAYHEKGMYDEAIVELKGAIEINPNDAKAHYNLGVAYDTKGMYDKAIVELKRATKINPNYAEAHHNLGIAYYAKGMYDKAIAEWKKAVEISPEYAPAHTNLGAAYAGKGMFDEAIAEWKKAVEINPNDAMAHYGLGVAHYEKGMYDKAIVEFERATKINPNHAKAHYNLAVAYYYEGEYSLAIEHCDRAIELGYRVHPEFLKALEPYRKK